MLHSDKICSYSLLKALNHRGVLECLQFSKAFLERNLYDFKPQRVYFLSSLLKLGTFTFFWKVKLFFIWIYFFFYHNNYSLLKSIKIECMIGNNIVTTLIHYFLWKVMQKNQFLKKERKKERRLEKYLRS